MPILFRSPLMLRSFSSLLATAVIFLPAVLHGETRRVTIDPAKGQGTWDGWGVSLAWWAAVRGDSEELADALFTQKSVTIGNDVVPGLGLNIVRYNAGASSWNTVGSRRMVESKTIFRYRQMEGFWLDGANPDPESNSWSWSVDEKQRAMLAKAKQRGVNRFELFSNSPMWWMTKNDNPSGGPKPSDDNLAPEHERDFAIYLATIARRAADQWGVAFTTVSPFNEPRSDWWFADCKQEGCHFSVPTQARVLKLLREELERRNLQTLAISASEETYYDHAIGTWESFDKPTRALIGQVNVHGYQESNGDREKLFRLVHSEGNKPLWNSEYGDGDSSGLNMARNLHRDIARLRPTSWSYWQAIDGGGWGLLGSNLRRPDSTLRVNPKWQVLAQYTRNISRGSVILTTNDESTVCAFDPHEKKLTLVCLNDSDQPRDIEYDLSAFAASGDCVSRWMTEPERKSRYLQLASLPFDKKLVVNLTSKSLLTLVINGIVVEAER